MRIIVNRTPALATQRFGSKKLITFVLVDAVNRDVTELVVGHNTDVLVSIVRQRFISSLFLVVDGPINRYRLVALDFAIIAQVLLNQFDCILSLLLVVYLLLVTRRNLDGGRTRVSRIRLDRTIATKEEESGPPRVLIRCQS